VDEDGGITQDAAIAWLRDVYGKPEGAAVPQLWKAWASGEVRVRVTRDGWDRWDHIAEYGEDGAIGLDGEPVRLAPLRRERASKRERELLSQEEPNDALLQGSFIHGLRYNAEDLWWQIEQQLDKLAVPAPQRLDQGRTAASEQMDKGGAPSKVRDAVIEWYNGLPKNQRALSANKLADSYCGEKPKRPGTHRHVRQLIANIRAG
jgi:hypothetical protein